METTTTTGTGDLTLAGASAPWAAFGDRYSDGDTLWVAIKDGANYEICKGTYNLGANSISRGTIVKTSEAADARVSFSAGTKDIYPTMPGEKVLFEDDNGVIAQAIVAQKSATGQTASGSADALVAERNAGSTGLSILTDPSSIGGIHFGDTGNNAIGKIEYDHSSDALIFTANAAERVRMLNDGKVGIGISTPDGTLHVHTGSAGAVAANVVADDLVVEGGTAGGVGITILGPNTGQQYLAFGDPDNGFIGHIAYDHSSKFMAFTVEGTEVAKFDSSGNFGIGAGTAALDGTLHVHTGSAGTAVAHTDANDLVVENSANGGINILVPDANDSNLYFGSPADNKAAVVRWNHNADLMTIGTFNAGGEVAFVSGSTVEAMRILSNQDIRLSGGTSALATGAIAGFPGIPTMAGAPSGVPTNASAGNAAIVYDSSNQTLEVYDPIAAAWRTITTA